ncbi:unnamed protein product [Soboliphyme baturini]|uniref:MCS n=1 Tax=Soboliphyme baturini TaxID=241478 RepID=A0A183IDH2_9BILA|nr:unnamed protein product [Soboliphyme baturini]
MNPDLIYLDNAGAPRCSSDLLEAILKDTVAAGYGNPHSRNNLSMSTSEVISRTRIRILSHFNTTSKDYSVIFTSGATAALKLLAETFPWQPSCSHCCGHQTADCASRTSLFQVSGNQLPSGSLFAYLLDNHTSVIGMREYALDAGASVICLKETDVQRLLLQSADLCPRCDCRALFVYPGQSNFCGRKYPSKWITAIQQRSLNGASWSVCVDAAALLSCDTVDLSRYPADFVALSFYKIFGYPTGIGALLVKNNVASCMKKKYFGGGSVFAYLPSSRFCKPRDSIEERFEDGTVPFQQIASLNLGFDEFNNKGGGASSIKHYVFRLTKLVYDFLSSLKHFNGAPVARLYCCTDFESCDRQGGIVNFNLKSVNGSWIGYSTIEKLADACGVCLRSGCFCNIGACQQHLDLSDEEVVQNYEHGKRCGDQVDIVNGKPVGSVRVSFGWLSTEADVDAFFRFITSCFVERSFPHPSSWSAVCHQEIFYDCSEEHVVDTIESSMKLSSIFFYPVKSCRPVRVDHWLVTRNGLLFDRHWMIVDASNACVTLKQLPSLVAVQPLMDLKERTLELSAVNKIGDFEKLHVRIDAANDPYAKNVETKVCLRRYGY